MRPTLRLSLIVAALSLLLVALASACGGSDGPETVNGCEIQAETSCPGVDLSDADLEGTDLSGADLSGATLDGTNLSEANLSEANLTDAQISNADLSDADLTGATLEGAAISGTNLDGATLCGTIRTDGTTDDSSCPASSDTTDTTETTGTDTTGAQGAEVTSFTVADLDCPSGGGDGSVGVSWATEAATAVRLEVDGAEVQSAGPSGSADLAVPCDGAEHEVSVVPLSDAGAGEADTETVSSG